ncbi:hypothetical protein [Kocuria sabuli]|uniref:hypothetical protein n=1 Tax=Kocuria sabuli TaxID=3071448 RepID=UPI0034D4C022
MDNYDLTWPTLTLVIGAISWIVGTGLRRGAFLAPYSLILLILLSIFGFRPLLMPNEPASFAFYGYNIASGYELASIIGFAGTIAFVVGYAARNLYSQGKTPTSIPVPALPRLTPGRANCAAWVLLALWLLIMIVVGGGPGFLSLLFAGRSEAVNRVFAGLPAFVPALPVVACLMVATIRFKSERIRRYTPQQNLAYWIVAVAAVVPPSALGTRRFLIPSVIIMVVGSFAQTWNRKVRPAWLAAVVVAFLVLAIVPFVRSAGSRVGGRTDLLGAMSVYFRDEGARGTLDNFFLSYDTEMFNWLAYFGPRMGESVPYGWGRGTIGELLASPLPASLAPLDRWNDVLLGYAFDTACSLETVCPVPSIVGILFTDMSWIGLIFGMFLLGVLAGGFERTLLYSSGNYTAALLLVAGFSVLFARGNSMAQAWIAVQVFVVWWVAYTAMSIMSAPPRRSTERARARKREEVPS